ncbi:MAG: DUF167 domain-containing protein [Acidobacteria bacterium]|nr:DUF167 domain-containing protein [Acidobacteriota bacterium]
MILRLIVQPRAKRNGFAGKVQEAWKLQLTAPPVEGKANEACVEFFCRGLGIARSRVRLLSGEKSRQKVVELIGVSEEDFLRFASADPRGKAPQRP